MAAITQLGSAAPAIMGRRYGSFGRNGPPPSIGTPDAWFNAPELGNNFSAPKIGANFTAPKLGNNFTAQRK